MSVRTSGSPWRDPSTRRTAAAGLTLHPTKTRLLDASQRGGFDFLGYHFERGMHWPSKKARARLRERLRPLTRRPNGHSLACIVARLNPVLRGWYTSFQHGRVYDLPQLDGWVHMRLRALQRKRHRHKGRGRRRDCQRWPHAFFAVLGLFSLAAAHAPGSGWGQSTEAITRWARQQSDVALRHRRRSGERVSSLGAVLNEAVRNPDELRRTLTCHITEVQRTDGGGQLC